ncbi:UDP-glucose/GDP-mannose dehydrogenase family protein [Castellaniella ginsengisoli]|uniref:UDP-glucose 6-dehydrogenase n=1 Tax=Castellaniella ginsengisoli TaxID=546114 RepID=A0AB39CHQ9_9BURK
MNIAIIGTGYVGLVTGACFAQAGFNVTCLDKDLHKIALLRQGRMPFHEPGLEALIAEGQASGRLSFQSTLEPDLSLERAEAIFLAVGTPTGPDGRAALADLLECAGLLARTLTHGAVIVIKSTVPVGTCEQVRSTLETQSPFIPPPRFTVASNPEFLAEGRAIEDFRHPGRIVIGCDDAQACRVLRTLYAPFDPDGSRTLVMDVRSAEFAKYACNAALAARISMINELACIAGQLAVDMRAVCKVLTSDPRIGRHYLKPGAGYGGSCLPKDLRALIAMAQDHGEPAYLLHSVETVNTGQCERLLDTLRACMAYDFKGRCVALWGLTFKADTDDMREAPSLALAHGLLEAGARVQAYDPVAGQSAQALLADPMFEPCADAYRACEGADVLVVMTDWEEFRRADFARVAERLSLSLVFDCRQIYEAASLARHGLRHLEIGQRPPAAASRPFIDALQSAV